MTSREGPSTSSSVLCEENDDGAISARCKRDSNRVYFGASLDRFPSVRCFERLEDIFFASNVVVILSIPRLCIKLIPIVFEDFKTWMY